MPDEDFALKFKSFGAKFKNKDALRCQNPWFLGWEDAVEMWTFSPAAAAAEEGEEGEQEGEGEEEKVQVQVA